MRTLRYSLDFAIAGFAVFSLAASGTAIASGSSIGNDSSAIRNAQRNQNSEQAQLNRRRFEMRWVGVAPSTSTLYQDQVNRENSLQAVGFTGRPENRDPSLMKIDDCGQSCFYQKANQWITLGQTYDYELTRNAISAFQRKDYDGVFRSMGEVCGPYRPASGAGDSDKEDAAKKCLKFAGTERARNALLAANAKHLNSDMGARLHGGASVINVTKNSEGKVERIDPQVGQPRWNSATHFGAPQAGVRQMVYVPTLSATGAKGEPEGDLEKDYKRLTRMSAVAMESYRTDEVEKAAALKTVAFDGGRNVRRDVNDPRYGEIRLPSDTVDAKTNMALAKMNGTTKTLATDLEKVKVPVQGGGGEMIITGEQRIAYAAARMLAIDAVTNHQKELMDPKRQAVRAPAKAKAPAAVASGTALVNANAPDAGRSQVFLGERIRGAEVVGDATQNTYDWDTADMVKSVEQNLVAPIEQMK